MAVIGMILAIGLLIFNKKFGYRGIIIQSQPQCNSTLIIGCLLCLSSLLLMGLPVEGMTIPGGAFTLLCHVSWEGLKNLWSNMINDVIVD